MARSRPLQESREGSVIRGCMDTRCIILQYRLTPSLSLDILLWSVIIRGSPPPWRNAFAAPSWDSAAVLLVARSSTTCSAMFSSPSAYDIVCPFAWFVGTLDNRTLDYQRSCKTDILSRGIHPYFPRSYYLSILRICAAPVSTSDCPLAASCPS